MSATNSTPTISLPLFIGTDKPAWLTDWNGAMNTIDNAIATLQAAESGTATSLAALSQSLTALSGTVDQHTTSLQTLTTAVSGNTGSINTINSLIGNGEPTTTDKTIIGAINELHEDIQEIAPSGGVAADDVSYDNQTSGLTATDVQAAIDELAQGAGGTVEADDVVYDNTSSGLTATNVQAAIDEVNDKIVVSGYECTKLNSATVTLSGTVTVADFSGYDAVMFVVHAANNYYSEIIPISLFTAGLLWSLTSSNCNIQYVSDTSVTFTLPSGDNGELYGIKY